MSLQKEFDLIDQILATKNESNLTDEEKKLLELNWKRVYARWANSENQATSQFALDTQVRVLFSNTIVDVLSYTRKRNIR